MTIEGAIRESGLPVREAELLIGASLHAPRSWVIAHRDAAIPESELRTLLAWMTRRNAGEPLAYITGEKEFFGRMFSVRRGVLVPRPATEILVEVALEVLKEPMNDVRAVEPHIVVWSQGLRSLGPCTTVCDIGTGSGCIAITLVLEQPALRVIATDVSREAIEVASANAKKLQANVEFRAGNLLEALKDLREPFLIVANPPYVPDIPEYRTQELSFEPPGALFAGEDGMDVLRPLVTQALQHPLCSGFVLECRSEQQVELLKTLPH